MTKYDDVELARDRPPRPLPELLLERWKSAVLSTLSEGMQRTSEVARNVPGIFKKMLTQTLRILVSWEMASRKFSAKGRAHVHLAWNAIH